VYYAQFDAANQYPNDIAKSAHDSEAAGTNVASEGPKHKSRNFEALHSEWYADDDDTQQKTDDRPQNRGYYST
jgi:hypothetical protein